MPEPILQALKQCNTFVSGTALSAASGITRAAVWKRIKALRKKGFVIEAVPSKGYRLVAVPELSAQEIQGHLKGKLWNKIVVLDSVDSTNTYAASALPSLPLSAAMAVISDCQRSGKGRLGRKWLSPAGINIYMSLVIRPEIEPRDAAFLTMLASAAAATAVSRAAGVDVRLKWPNDLMVKEKKIGGILTEVRSEPDRITAAIIGMGINVNMAADQFSDEIRETATSLYAVTGRHHSRDRIISEILDYFERLYRAFLKKGREFLLTEWRALSCTLGRNVKVSLMNETIKGLAADVDSEGRLVIITPEGGEKKISAGDISFLR